MRLGAARRRDVDDFLTSGFFTSGFSVSVFSDFFLGVAFGLDLDGVETSSVELILS